MIRQALGTALGGALGRRGGGGVKGMLLGAAATRVLPRIGPVGWVVGGGLFAGKWLYDRHRQRRDAAIPPVVSPGRD